MAGATGVFDSVSQCIVQASFSETAKPFVVLGMSFGGGQNVRLWDLVNNKEVGKLQDKIERVEAVLL